MKREEIKEFLKEKRGYLKEGGKRLRDVLLKKGFISTIKDCKQAIREVTKELKSGKKKDTTPPRILIYDIETSYNIVKSWRVGYQLNINPSDILSERKIICI